MFLFFRITARRQLFDFVSNDDDSDEDNCWEFKYNYHH